ncbi:DUF4230 domain-containing protein [Catellatospora tritici]|uniref:DUF4230 domain-containing protein n=1 Tax=Catellatospora tritici TaxID=2851566 RepID=UPI001C2D00C5|nr:DUF4230 domain-containing protein [Catellatospora tritici]MBV1856644.1 DUF4230 domain-containing protein [Catellatospora tritici]
MGADEPTQNLPEYSPGRAKPTEPLPTLRAKGTDPDDDHDHEHEPPRPRRRWFRGILLTFLVLALAGIAVGGLTVAGLIPKLRNPFAEQVTDKSQPPVLLSIKDLSRFVAAEGNYEVIVDLKEDRKFLPDWLYNQHTLFVAAGTVEAYVDFSQLTEAQIIDSADHKTVTINLPAPQLAAPNLDLDRSYVYAEDRGLINRVGDFFDGDPNRQQETMQAAEEKLKNAAQGSQLKERAQENTRKTLEGLLHSLGYTNVTITFNDL